MEIKFNYLEADIEKAEIPPHTLYRMEPYIFTTLNEARLMRDLEAKI